MRHMRCFIFIGCLFAAGVVKAQQAFPKDMTLTFEGNKVFATTQLVNLANGCLATRPQINHEYTTTDMDYCLWKVKLFVTAKGYLRATVGNPRNETENGSRIIVVAIQEGALYRLGEVEISGSKLFSPSQVREMMGLRKGDIANAETLSVGLYERVKEAYSDFGYIQYTAEVEPTFHIKDGAQEGVVDFRVTIDEGDAFTIRSIKFGGNGDVSEDGLRNGMLVRVGEVFNKELFDESLKRMSQTGQFEMIDVDKDVDYTWDQKSPRVDLTIHLKKRVPAT
jgi:outer membrane protein assembly factor BamA